MPSNLCPSRHVVLRGVRFQRVRPFLTRLRASPPNKGDAPTPNSSSGKDEDQVPDLVSEEIDKFFLGRKAAEFSPQGNLSLQDELVERLSIEVKKETINETTRQEEQKLIDTADQAKMEIDLYGMELQARTDAAFDSALAKINQMADEMEEELRRQREQMERDQRAVDDFEELAVRRQNEGVFFKGLYAASKGAKERQKASRRAGMEEGEGGAGPSNAQSILEELEREEARKREEAAQERAREQLRSPVRQAYYAFLLIVLLSVCGYEVLAAAEPSWGHVGIYGGISVVLGLQLNRERKLEEKE